MSASTCYGSQSTPKVRVAGLCEIFFQATAIKVPHPGGPCRLGRVGPLIKPAKLNHRLRAKQASNACALLAIEPPDKETV
jgi:hypothetical protein